MDPRLRLGLMAAQAVGGALAIPYVLTKAGNWALDRLGIQDANDENAGVLDEQAERFIEARRARIMKRAHSPPGGWLPRGEAYRSTKRRAIRLGSNRTVTFNIPPGGLSRKWKTPKGKGPISAQPARAVSGPAAMSVRMPSGPAPMSVRGPSAREYPVDDSQLDMHTATFFNAGPQRVVERVSQPSRMAYANRKKSALAFRRKWSRFVRSRRRSAKGGISFGGQTRKKKGAIRAFAKSARIAKAIVPYRPRDPLNPRAFSRKGNYKRRLSTKIPVYRAVQDVAITIGEGVQHVPANPGSTPPTPATWTTAWQFYNGQGYQKVMTREIPPLSWSVATASGHRILSPFFLDMPLPSHQHGLMAIQADPREYQQYLHNANTCTSRRTVSILEQEIILELGIDVMQIANRAPAVMQPGDETQIPNATHAAMSAGYYDPFTDPVQTRLEDKFRVVVLELRGQLDDASLLVSGQVPYYALTDVMGSACSMRMERFFETSLTAGTFDEDAHFYRNRMDFFAPVLPTPRIFENETGVSCDMWRNISIGVLYDQVIDCSPRLITGMLTNAHTVQVPQHTVQVPIYLKKRYTLDTSTVPSPAFNVGETGVEATVDATNRTLHAENVNVIIFAIPFNGTACGGNGTSINPSIPSPPTPSYVWGGHRRFSFEIPDPA